MRIGIDIFKALPPRDGVGSYTAELVRELVAVCDDEIFLYSLPLPLDLDVVHEQFPDLPERVRPRMTAPCDDALDVFHAPGWAFPEAYAGPAVFTCHDLTFYTHPDHHVFNNKVHCTVGTLRACLAGATFLAVSQATARELIAELGLPSSRIRVVYEAAAPCFRPLPGDEARRRIGERFGIDGPFVLAVGTIEPRKNLRRLVEAYLGLDEELRRTHPLLLAGAEGWKNALGDVVQGDTVRRLGFVERDDLVALYNSATVFAYPSLIEGFGLPVVEAMACGTAVLTSNVSSLPEVAGAGARLVDPLDVEDIHQALRELLLDSEERHRLREKGLRRAGELSWEITARQTLDVYREVAARSPRSS